MKTSRKLLYLGSFFGLAVTAILAVDRMGRPTVAPMLLWAVIVATVAGAPGLVRRRAWPVALALLPLGALVILRTQMPVPSDLRGLGEQTTFYVEQLRSGVHAYATHGFPMDFATAGDLKLLLSLIVYAVVGLAAFVALSLRRAVPAVAILLVPLGFGLTVDREARVVGLPLAFLVLVGCLLLFSRAMQRERWRGGDTAAGIGTTTIAALLALWVLGATSVTASEPWQDWRAWDLKVRDDARFVFDSMEGYAGLLDPEANEQVMRVRSPVASYWRANALDDFDGMTWFSGASVRSRLEVAEKGGSYSYAVPALGLVAPGTLVRQSFEIRSMETDYFFTGGTAETLVVGRDVPVHARDTYALGVDRPLGPPLEYGVTAVVPELEPADLVGRGRDYPREVLLRAKLPFPTPSDSAATATEADWRSAMADHPIHGEWLGVYQLNRDIVGDATDPYEIALRIEQYLRLNYTYSLTPPSAEGQSPYAAFLLKTKEGFCQHFAGAMAALVRFNGVPARVAVGFAPGVQVAEDAFVVSRNDAHAWVEVYFPRVGWVPFEPTPGQGMPGPGASSTSADFKDPYAQDVGTVVEDRPAVDADAPRGLKENPSAGVSDTAAVTPAAPASARGRMPWAVPAGAVVLLFAWPLGRALLRRRGLRRGDPGCRLRASLTLVRIELGDFGIEVPRSQTLEETSRLLSKRLDLDATALVDAVQEVLWGGRAATEQDLTAVAAFRRELRRRLRTRSGWRRTILALYGLGARGDTSRRAPVIPTPRYTYAPRVGR